MMKIIWLFLEGLYGGVPYAAFSIDLMNEVFNENEENDQKA